MKLPMTWRTSLWIGAESIHGHWCLNLPDPWKRHKYLELPTSKRNSISLKLMLRTISMLRCKWRTPYGFLPLALEGYSKKIHCYNVNTVSFSIAVEVWYFHLKCVLKTFHSFILLNKNKGMLVHTFKRKHNMIVKLSMWEESQLSNITYVLIHITSRDGTDTQT